jgi:protein-L-isoaspartate(D-aspartate) O-methyltransferase
MRAAASAARLLDGSVPHCAPRAGDGCGWPDAAPFDGIIVTAAIDHTQAARRAIEPGGRLRSMADTLRPATRGVRQGPGGALERRDVLAVRRPRNRTRRSSAAAYLAGT